jgi:transcriptional regulator with XRE-family HTH domain
MRLKIGSEIKRLRKEQRFTQEHIALKLDMSVAGYSRIERDEVNVTLDRLQELAEILGTTPEFILGIHDESGTLIAPEPMGEQAYVTKIEKLYQDQIGQLKEEVLFLREQLRRFELAED